MRLKSLDQLKHFYYKEFRKAKVSRKEINSFFKSFKNISTEILSEYLRMFLWTNMCLRCCNNSQFEWLKRQYLEELLILKSAKPLRVNWRAIKRLYKEK